MNIYFSGIGGVGIGPLAEIAHDAGYEVAGSDIAESPITKQLMKRGIEVQIGQDGSQIAKIHAQKPIDWLVHTSGLPDNHPELVFARQNDIRTSKRDELLAQIIKNKNLKLIAVAGTHGKTTTTGMLVWLFKQLGIPIGYSVGTTLSFGPSGAYELGSEYFIYECDEYDRNFLQFSPYLSVLTAVDYDHKDTYPTREDYKAAFYQFVAKSQWAICEAKTKDYLDLPTKDNLYCPDSNLADGIKLPGQHNRQNSVLAVAAVHELTKTPLGTLSELIAKFPGTDRRFEKLADNLYSDYGHHPIEIAATLQLARELNDQVVLVYQPHQNTRQHEIKDQYKDSMALAEHIYWLPTYLSRENPELEVLSPQDLISQLSNASQAEPAEMNEQLWQHIEDARSKGQLVLVMGAGSIDQWIRAKLSGA